MISGTFVADTYDITIDGKTYLGEFDTNESLSSSTVEAIVGMYRNIVYRYKQGDILMSNLLFEKRLGLSWSQISDEYFQKTGGTYKIDGTKIVMYDDTGKENGVGTLENNVLTLKIIGPFGDGTQLKFTYKKVTD